MLHDAIVSHLKESIIAKQMSVNRIPVREAFRQLEQNVSK